MSRAAAMHQGRVRHRPTGREAAPLVILELLMGVGAVYGGWALIQDAAGFGVKEEWLRYGVFDDYTVPGAILIAALGGSMLAAAAMALVRNSAAFAAAAVAGLTLLVFLVVETALLGYHGPQQLVLVAVCGGTGLALVLLGCRGCR